VIAEKPQEKQIDLVLLDIGNRNIALATWTNGKRNDAQHLPVDSVDQIMEAVQAKWDALSNSVTRAVVVSTVNPPVLETLRSRCKSKGIEPLLIVGENIEPPMGADVPSPEKIGMDRLCTAAAAYDRLKAACVVADFGTAVTIDLIADNGVFLGGTIIPGMHLAARALHEHTAQLPLVEMGASEQILGKDTTSCIRNGVFAMMCGALREITERYATEIGKWPPLVVTGGDGKAVAQGCDFVDRMAEDLCLDGLVLAFKKFASQEAAE
jgi:type III pantothenate kinase